MESGKLSLVRLDDLQLAAKLTSSSSTGVVTTALFLLFFHLPPSPFVFIILNTGISCILAGQVMRGTQMVVEERFLKSRLLHPLHVSVLAFEPILKLCRKVKKKKKFSLEGISAGAAWV